MQTAAPRLIRCNMTNHAIRRMAQTAVHTGSLLIARPVAPVAAHVARRGFFWQKKAPEQPEVVFNPKTTVTKEREVKDDGKAEERQRAADAEAEAAKLATKAGRLGFGDVGDAFNQVINAWPRIKTYTTWVFVGTGMLFVFKFGLNTIDFFATLNFLDVGEVAFISGLVSGVGLVACGWAGTRFLRLRPEPIFQNALRRINSDSTVVQYMGQKIVPGSFRAYSFVNGAPRVTQEQRDRARIKTGVYKYWQPKRLQLSGQRVDMGHAEEGTKGQRVTSTDDRPNSPPLPLCHLSHSALLLLSFVLSSCVLLLFCSVFSR